MSMPMDPSMLAMGWKDQLKKWWREYMESHTAFEMLDGVIQSPFNGHAPTEDEIRKEVRDRTEFIKDESKQKMIDLLKEAKKKRQDKLKEFHKKGEHKWDDLMESQDKAYDQAIDELQKILKEKKEKEEQEKNQSPKLPKVDASHKVPLALGGLALIAVATRIAMPGGGDNGGIQRIADLVQPDPQSAVVRSLPVEMPTSFNTSLLPNTERDVAQSPVETPSDAAQPEAVNEPSSAPGTSGTPPVVSRPAQPAPVEPLIDFFDPSSVVTATPVNAPGVSMQPDTTPGTGVVVRPQTPSVVSVPPVVSQVVEPKPQIALQPQPMTQPVLAAVQDGPTSVATNNLPSTTTAPNVTTPATSTAPKAEPPATTVQPQTTAVTKPPVVTEPVQAAVSPPTTQTAVVPQVTVTKKEEKPVVAEVPAAKPQTTNALTTQTTLTTMAPAPVNPKLKDPVVVTVPPPAAAPVTQVSTGPAIAPQPKKPIDYTNSALGPNSAKPKAPATQPVPAASAPVINTTVGVPSVNGVPIYQPYPSSNGANAGPTKAQQVASTLLGGPGIAVR